MAVYKDKNKTKDGRSWYFKIYKKDYNGINKAYKSKRYLTKKDAQEAEALFRLKKEQPYNKLFKLVWLDYIDDLSKKKKESTVYTYKKDYNKHIKPFFENKYINELTVNNIREWASKLEKTGLSVPYMNKIHNVLNNIFDFAIKNYELPSNPSRLFGTFEIKQGKVVKDEEKLKYITYEQFCKFIEVIDSSLYKTFFIFLYYTGCRKSEIQALTWNDIDFNSKLITINKTLSVKTEKQFKITSTKNNINRKIKMNKTLYEVLLEYKKEVNEFEDFSNNWFVFGNTRYLSQTNIDRYKHKYFELSGINEITIHQFRHSCVSLLINQYIKESKEKNIKIDTAKFFLMMSNRMGHSVQVMQNTYMHLFPTVQDEIVDLLDNL